MAAVVLVVVLLSVAAAFAYSELRATRYAATIDVQVTPLDPSTGYAGLSTVDISSEPARSVETAVGLLDTVSVRAATATSLGDGWTASKVDSAVTVAPHGQSYLVQIRGTGRSSSEAAEIVQRFATQALAIHNSLVIKQAAAQISAIEKQQSQFADTSDVLGPRLALLRTVEAGGDPSLTYVDDLDAPMTPVGLTRSTVLELGLVIGLVIGGVAAYGLRAASGASPLARRTWPEREDDASSVERG